MRGSADIALPGETANHIGAAATEKIQSEASREWAALRARPRPELMSAMPAIARGARRMQMRTTAVSAVKIGAGTDVTLFPHGERIRANDQGQSQDFHGDSGEHENGFGVGRQEKNYRGGNNDPSGEQEQKSRELHEPSPCLAP